MKTNLLIFLLDISMEYSNTIHLQWKSSYLLIHDTSTILTP